MNNHGNKKCTNKQTNSVAHKAHVNTRRDIILVLWIETIKVASPPSKDRILMRCAARARTSIPMFAAAAISATALASTPAVSLPAPVRTERRVRGGRPPAPAASCRDLVKEPTALHVRDQACTYNNVSGHRHRWGERIIYGT